MNIYEKLTEIQCELKAPKSQYNSFGKYNYRSCEDILTAVKPLTKKYKTTLIVTDNVRDIQDRFYVSALARLVDNEKPSDYIEVYASAREEDSKKGMDGSQVTGTASSYARKYALNGLFAIDDTKDADTNEYQKQSTKAEPKKTTAQKKTSDTKPTTKLAITCPKCGKEITAMEQNGKTYQPAAVFKAYGCCAECHNKEKVKETTND